MPPNSSERWIPSSFLSIGHPSPASPSPPLRRHFDSNTCEFSFPLFLFSVLADFSQGTTPSLRRDLAAFATALRCFQNVQHSPALSVAAGQRPFSAGVAPRMRSLFETPVCRAWAAVCARWHDQQVSALHRTPQGVSPAGKSPDRGRRSPSVSPANF
jgi:hypothetical protein